MASLIFGERSLSMVVGIFDQAQQARDAAQHVVDEGRLARKQVEVVGPGDPAVEQKLEPEEAGIFRTAVKAHITLGIVGMLVGLALAAALLVAGVDFVISSPYFTFIIGAVFGAMFGAMFGGLVTLRPDHDMAIVKVEEAVQEGHWAVVVHPVNHDQEARARNVLEHATGAVTGTL